MASKFQIILIFAYQHTLSIKRSILTNYKSYHVELEKETDHICLWAKIMSDYSDICYFYSEEADIFGGGYLETILGETLYISSCIRK